MPRLIVLNSSPLHLLTTRSGVEAGERCREWFRSARLAGNALAIPSIADFEVRRELIRRRASARLRHLDQLVAMVPFLDVTRDALFLAAELWADVPNKGLRTASDDSLDGDCIIAAQAIIAADGGPYVVATKSPEHIGRYCPAEDWEGIA